jgi:hypothetical protein
VAQTVKIQKNEFLEGETAGREKRRARLAALFGLAEVKDLQV